MIEIFRKKAGLLVRELYFAPGIVACAAHRDIDVYIQCSSPIEESKPFWTVSADLSQDEDVLFHGLVKNHRYEVRRAADKDELVVDVNFTPTIEDMASFRSFFNDFAAFRGIASANISKLESFRNSGHLVIVSVQGGNENFPLAMHCYVSDGYRVRLYHSATSPRVGDNGSLIGRANKLLHWQTMLMMKNAGLKIYDFGGISHSTELQGIDNFKRQFGGVESEDYNAILGVSRIGRLALKTSNLLDRFTKAAES